MTPYDFYLEPPADDETIDALAEQYAKDPKMIAEADEYMQGVLDNFYDGMESLFANISDNGLMPEYVDKILSLAKIAGAARAERIYWLAERDAPSAFEKPEDYDVDR